MDTPTPFEAFELCLTTAGSQTALGEALGCSQTAIWKMLQSAKRMSHQYVLIAERLYGVSRHDLRPDIYPRALAPAKLVDRGGGDRFYGVEQAA